MSFSIWLAFAAAAIVLLIMPGPTVTLVIAYALGQGRRASLAMVAGVALGDLVAMVVSLAGMGALLAASATLYAVLRYAGAAYLVYLGIKLWRSNPTAEALAGRASATTLRAIFLHAFLVTATNPKGMVFFIAFVPQFIDPNSAYWPQAAILIATFVILASINSFLYALAASAARERITRPGVLRAVNRAGAGVLIAAGASVVAMGRG